MIAPTNQPEPAAAPNAQPSVKVIGIGGAAASVVAGLAATAPERVSCAALCTKARTLASLNLPEKRVIGLNVTRGLGAGGDPQMGRAAATADLEAIRPMFKDVDILFLVAGLGGGTAVGAAPVLARAARESGALVLGVVTLPFEFEGRRRQQQAFDGLQELKDAADSVLCLPNQRLAKLIENVRYEDVFQLTDELLTDGIRGVCRLLTRDGLIKVDFADLRAVTRGRRMESCFASAETSGERRVEDLVEKILGHPLLDEGAALAEARSVLISLQGGPDLTMSEVRRVMDRMNRQCGPANVTFGAVTDPAFEGRLAMTVIATRGSGEPAEEPEVLSAPRSNTTPIAPASELFGGPEPARPPSRYVPPAPDLTEEQKKKILNLQSTGARKLGRPPRQTQLPLDIVPKSRFAKSEPTIHQGEDLDIPTYIRRGLSLN